MREEKFRKFIREIFDEKETPENLDRKIMGYINHKRYIRNMTISIAASLIIVILMVFFFSPKNIKITEEKIKIENRIVKKQEEIKNTNDSLFKKKEIVKKNDEKNKEFYVVFPKDEDIIEEAGGLVFYIRGDINKIKYEIDGEIFEKVISDEEGTIVIPTVLEEGTHILKIHYPYETEIMFYSVGEV